MDNIPVDVPQEQAAPPLINMDVGQPTVPLPDDVAATRTSKAAYGLSFMNKPYEDIQRSIRGNGELPLREEASSQKNADLSQRVNDAIFQLASNRGSPLTSDEINAVKQNVIANDDFTSPHDVIEQTYSRKYFGVLANDVQPGHWYDDLIQEDTDGVDKVTGLARDYTSKRQVLQTALENAQAVATNQSWGGYLTDKAKDIASLGIYDELKERGNVAGSSFFGGLLGSNKEQQRINLFRQPMGQFTQSVKDITDKMIKDNPTLAVQFIQSMLGNSDVDMENFMSAVTLGTFPGVGTGLKMGARGAGALSIATKDLVKGTESVLPPKISANVAAGNLAEAGIAKATAEVVGDMAGTSNPAKDAVQALPNILREASEAVAENPGKGPGAQEVANRISAAFSKTANNIGEIISKFQRGSRIPAALATENSIRLLADAEKEAYRGIDSRVVDIKGPFHNTLSNTLDWELQIGKHDGTLFGDRETAYNAAHVEGIQLKGEGDMARQIQLQRLLAQTQYELDTARAAASLYKRSGDTAANLRDKLNINKMSQRPDFNQNIKTLEGNISKYNNELADLRKAPGATIEQQGAKFYISKYNPLRETSPEVRALLNSTPESKPPSGFYTSFLAAWRGGENTTSKDNMALAKQAIYGQNNLLAMAKAELEPFRKLARWTFPGTTRRQDFLDLNDTLKAGRTEGIFEHPAQLEDYFLKHYKHLPSDQQKEAYFSAVRYGQLQDVLRSVDMHTNEARLGTKLYRIKINDENGLPTSSVQFKAISRNEAPTNQDGILIMGSKLGEERITKGIKNKETIQAIKEGRKKVLEIVYHNDSPLKGFGKIIGDNYIKYVVTDSIDEAPLQFTKVDRSGGGLWDLDYKHYIKQARVVRDEASKTYRYKGDVTLMPFESNALGQNITKLLEDVRGHILNRDEASAIAAAKKTGIEYKTIKEWFEPKTNADGSVSPAKLDPNTPLRLVPGNKLTVNMDTSLADKYGSAFRDDTRGNLIHQNLIKGEHDNYELYTVKDVGHRNNPIYQYEPAQYIDPIPSMNRAMKRIADSTYMDDYKLFAVEHWVQQAKGYMDATDNQLANSPMYYFFHGDYVKNIPIDVKNRLEDARYKAQQIWGTPSSTDTSLHAISQRMSDSVYTNFGPKMIDPSWVIARLTDGASIVKAATFHTAIGLFAWPQFLVQNMTWATIAGLEGVGHASSGAAASMFHLWASVNPHAIDFLDNLMTKLPIPSISGGGLVRWKPGEFKEAFQLLQNSGFMKVGKDSSLVDNPFTHKVISTAGGQVLDAGTIFYKAGEKSVRAGAWYTAYRKLRDEIPTGALSQNDLSQLLNRADILSGSMSAASKSALQRGPLAFTTQFLGYNLRMAELVMSKRITMAQRARLIGTYWGLFGVSAAGLSGLPIGDWMRNKAIENGYTADPGAYSTWATEGIPAAALQLVTGKLPGIGQRLGSVGFDPIREALAGDKPTWEILGGAPASFLKSMYTQTDGFKKALLSIADTDEKTHFPMQATDVDNALKVASSYNSISRYMHALNSSNWVTKKGSTVDADVSPLNATIMTMSGVQDQRYYNVQNKIELENARKDDLARTETAFLSEIRHFTQAVKDKDFDQARAYGIRAKAILTTSGYPITMIGSLLSKAERDNQPTIQRGDYNLYLGRNVPDAKREEYLKAYQRTQGNNK